MGTAITVIIIILVIVVILALIGMSAYNGFVKSRNVIQESWRQVDVELNRRYELIPNLVETVRAYAAHERNTLEDITRLRSQAQQLSQSEGALPSQQRAEVEEQLSGAVRNLIVSVEAYPDLKSNTNFLELQRQLAETEDRIANGRRYYNANVRVYNTKVESVPSNLIANMFKFEKATYFEVNDPAVRQAPNVSFGEIAYRGDPQQRGQQPPAAGAGVRTASRTRCPTRSSTQQPPYGDPPPREPREPQQTQPNPYTQPPHQAQAPGGYSAPDVPAAAAADSRPVRAATSRRRPDDPARFGPPVRVGVVTEMTYTQLGPSGLTVSTVGLGCNNFGARMADEDVPEVVHAAIDAGITLFDTADVYGNAGGSETLLGQALGSRRAEVVIATKFGGDMQGANGPDWGARGSRRYIRIAVESSLRRLGTDWIDLYQLHTPDPHTPIEETLAALDELVQEGKVRYLGSSNLAGWQVVDADWIARTSGLTGFVSAQNEYSWLNRDDRGRAGAGAGPHRPVAAAVLPAGPRPAHRQVPPGRGGAGRHAGWPSSPTRSEQADFDTIEAIEKFAAERGVSLLQIAIGGLAAMPTVGSVIAGATSVDQVEQNVAAGLWSPSEEDLAELQRITG